MKEIIEKIINQNDKITDFVTETRNELQNEKDVFPVFIEMLEQSHFNPALVNLFADLLQLSNDKYVYEQYDLEDISSLYDSIIKLQPSNLENYVDAAHFEYAVQDNNKKAQDLIEAGLIKIDQIKNELMLLQNKIKEDV